MRRVKLENKHKQYNYAQNMNLLWLKVRKRVDPRHDLEYFEKKYYKNHGIGAKVSYGFVDSRYRLTIIDKFTQTTTQ